MDGIHIKGLIMNLLEYGWPSLLECCPGFIKAICTPIVKCTKGSEVLSFYTLTEYDAWKQSTDGGRGWKIKVKPCVC